MIGSETSCYLLIRLRRHATGIYFLLNTQKFTSYVLLYLAIMSSIVTAVFKATIGLLVNKGRDKAAEKLKDGDVTDQKFRGLIVREIDDIKSKLDGLSRKDLLVSISFFKEGIELLYEVFDRDMSRSEYGPVTTQAACTEASVSLIKEVRNVDLTDLDDSTKRKLYDAKERFKDARRKATEAFSNVALETSDHILAMQYRVMATILEKVDNPADALTPCRVCIEELHALSSVQECFNVELTKGLRPWFGKDERRKNISDVCHVNFVIYDITLMMCFGNKELSNWPCIGSGEEKVDPLRDERVAEVLRKQGMEHCCLTPWSFVQEGEEEHKLKAPCGIATNCSGQYIVGDDEDGNVKVFDSSGTFMELFSLPNDDVDTELYILDVATDMKDNIFVLARLETPGAKRDELVVYAFNNAADLHHTFPVSGGGWGRLTIDRGKVLVLSSDDVVFVHQTSGQFVREFGRHTLKNASDITVAYDGRVMVVDWLDSCVHIFSEHGDHLNMLTHRGRYSYPRIAFHRASEHVVVAGKEREKDLLHVDIYTKDGEFARSTQIHEKNIDYLRGITATTKRRFALACEYKDLPAKVLVI